MSASSLTATIRVAAQLLEDPTPLRQERRWKANGDKGHWHADPGCWKLQMHARTKIGPMTQKGARMCPSCFSQATTSFRGAWAAAVDLRRVRDTLDQIAAAAQNAVDAATLLALQPSVRSVQDDLAKLSPNAEPVWTAYQDTCTAVDMLQATLTKAARGGAEEILRWAACATVDPTSKVSDADALLGPAPDRDGMTRHPPLRQLDELHTCWSVTLTRTGSLKLAADETRDMHGRTSRLTVATQLVGVPPALEPDPAGSCGPVDMAALAHTAWQAHADTTVNRLIAAWSSQYRAARKNDATALIGVTRVSPYRADETARALLESFTVSRPGELTQVLLLPRYAADIAVRHAGTWGWNDIVDAGLCPDRSTAATAATLWDPGSSGAYSDLRSALRAAVTV